MTTSKGWKGIAWNERCKTKKEIGKIEKKDGDNEFTEKREERK
jgi:hypothetical protein